MTKIAIPEQLTERERDLIDEFAQLLLADLAKWDEALKVNEERAEDALHDKQAERLADARAHYMAVGRRIIQPRLNEILNGNTGERDT